MYTAEMDKMGFEVNNSINIGIKYYVTFIENAIENKAKEGKNNCELYFNDRLIFNECINEVCRQLEEKGFNVKVKPENKEKGYKIYINW